MLFDVSIGNDTPFFLHFFRFSECVCVFLPADFHCPLVCIRVCVSFLNIHPVRVTNTEPQKVNILSIYELRTEICMMIVLSIFFFPRTIFPTHNFCPTQHTHCLKHQWTIVVTDHEKSSTIFSLELAYSSYTCMHIYTYSSDVKNDRDRMHRKLTISTDLCLSKHVLSMCVCVCVCSRARQCHDKRVIA